MIVAKNILKSKKRYGRYERPLIKALERFFIQKGYTVVPHAQFNLAWGAIISDLDLLLIKNNKLTIVEVKSKRDSVKKAKKQLEKLYCFADFAYLAVERIPDHFEMNHAGLVVVQKDRVKVIKTAKPLETIPNYEELAAIQKKCLLRLLDAEDNKHAKKIRKLDLALHILEQEKSQHFKKNIQEILTCGRYCETKCPIWSFSRS